MSGHGTVPLILNEGVDASDALKPAEDAPRCFLVDAPFVTSALALVNSALGAGILAFPFAFMSAGLLGAGILSAAMGSLSFMALCFIFHCMRKAQNTDPDVRDYGQLVRWGCGLRWQRFVEVLVVFYEYGACIGYIILLGDMIQPILPASLGLGRTAIECACTVPCVLLCALPSVSALKYTAATAVLASFLLVGVIAHQAITEPCKPGACTDEDGRDGWPKGGDGVSLWPEGAAGIFRALPLIAFALQCHMQSPLVFTELPTRIRLEPGPRRGVALLAVLLLLALYVPTGTFGFLRFGSATQADITENFGPTDTMANVARACMAVTALAGFPMQHLPARMAIHGVYRSLTSGGARVAAADAERASSTVAMAPPASTAATPAFLITESLLWCGSALAIALLAGDKISVVFQLTGAICGATVILIMPGVLWLRKGEGGRRSAKRVLPAVALVFSGSFILVAGTAVTAAQLFHLLPDHANSTDAVVLRPYLL